LACALLLALKRQLQVAREEKPFLSIHADSLPSPETTCDRMALRVWFGGTGVALGAADGEAEQVAQAADVPASGQGLVQDAVLADGPRGDAEDAELRRSFTLPRRNESRPDRHRP
jgi:hypothetical protein